MLIQCLGPTSLQAIRTLLHVVGEHQVKMGAKETEYYFVDWI
jgi:hypothetical protein